MHRRLLVPFVAACALLAAARAQEQAPGWLEKLGVEAHGFVDVRGGLRTRRDSHEGDTSLAEARLQLDLSRTGDLTTLQFRADLLGDDASEDANLDFEQGAGPLDLREANVLFSPVSFMDVKLGRQILTWGTGDLLFVNDLFPKDWQSFFLGRDDEYLKAPSDSVFVSLFPEFASIDIAYSPQFDADRYVRGERLSYWSPAAGDRVGRDAVVVPDPPDEWFDDHELAVRVSRNAAGYELAAYGYNGFWKSPEGQDRATGAPIFPRLAVYGASVRGALGSGLINAETGWYDSKDDRRGDDALVPNSEWRFLLGYERELARELTARVQYYVECMEDYGRYRAGLPPGPSTRDPARHTVTVRLTKQLLNQDLTLSLFARYSPADGDAYVRPTARYRLTDSWRLFAGADLFTGKDDYTFLAQFGNNTNFYAGARYSF